MRALRFLAGRVHVLGKHQGNIALHMLMSRRQMHQRARELCAGIKVTAAMSSMTASRTTATCATARALMTEQRPHQLRRLCQPPPHGLSILLHQTTRGSSASWTTAYFAYSIIIRACLLRRLALAQPALTKKPHRRQTSGVCAHWKSVKPTASLLMHCLCREEGPPPHRRERLPPPAQKEKSVSLWAILKVRASRPLEATHTMDWLLLARELQHIIAVVHHRARHVSSMLRGIFRGQYLLPRLTVVPLPTCSLVCRHYCHVADSIAPSVALRLQT